MALEVLIVGEAARRSELLEQIQGLGYEAALCSASDLAPRIHRGQIPGAVVVCTTDVEPRALMAELRRTRRGQGIPVTLYGPLGGRNDALADVLDLGADHFLEAPADTGQLAAALDELVGPGVAPSLRSFSGSHGAASPPRDGSSGATDAVLGQLHRTLDMLEVRLRDREQADTDADDLDLAALGFEALPDVGAGDPAPEDSGSSLELSRARMSSARRPVLRPRRDPTERLGGDEPMASSGPGPDPVEAPASPRRPALPIGEQGSLERIDVPRLLWMLHRAGYDGELLLRRGRIDKRSWWRGGDLVFAHSNVRHDQIVEGLLRRGLLTREQYEQARRIVDEDPRRGAARLVEAGLLKRSELPRVLRDQLIGVIDATFTWTEGSWQLRPDEGAGEPGGGDVPVALVVAEGVRQRMETASLLARLGGLDRQPRFVGDARQVRRLAEQILLTPSEEAWIARLDGDRSLAQLVAEPGADELELFGLVYTLGVLELVQWNARAPEAVAEVDPAAIDMQRIRDRLEHSREGDYFVVLGLPRDACRVDVRRAHVDLHRTFSDAALEASVRDAMRSELEELRDLLDEARDVLIDETLRSAYLAHLEEP